MSVATDHDGVSQRVRRDRLSAGQFFHSHAIDGRAVITFRQQPDDLGYPQPALWLCRLNGTLVLCDYVGPDHEGEVDEGCLEAIDPALSLADVVSIWRAHRRRMSKERRVRRRAVTMQRWLRAIDLSQIQPENPCPSSSLTN